MKYRILEDPILRDKLHNKIVICDCIKEVKPPSGKPYFLLYGKLEDDNLPICLPLEMFEIIQGE